MALVVGFFVVSRPFMNENDPKMKFFDHEQRMNVGFRLRDALEVLILTEMYLSTIMSLVAC